MNKPTRLLTLKYYMIITLIIIGTFFFLRLQIKPVIYAFYLLFATIPFLVNEITSGMIIIFKNESAGASRVTKVQLEQIKNRILKWYSKPNCKQLGDRLFGYLIKSQIIEADTAEEQKEEWKKFTGIQETPSDIRYIVNPSYVRDNNYKGTKENLEKIEIFLDNINLVKTKKYVRSDIDKIAQTHLSKK